MWRTWVRCPLDVYNATDRPFNGFIPRETIPEEDRLRLRAQPERDSACYVASMPKACASHRNGSSTLIG
jgi:hypothetical protein